MPELSAVLTVYNRADLLDRVLASVARQTLPRDRYELIIVDDGSSDVSSDVVQRFSPCLPIQYHYQVNAGLAAARNRGLEIARAPVVLMMDDDDVLLQGALAAHLRAHEKYPEEEVAVLGRTELAEDIRRDPLMHFVTAVAGYLFSYDGLEDGAFYGFDHFWGGRTSFKRRFAMDAGGFNAAFRFGCEDIELAYRLWKKGLKVLFSRKAASVMIRAITLDDFYTRLRRQGESQRVFSEIWREREVQEWCQVPQFEAEWPRLEPLAELHLNRARNLDRWVRDSLELGVAVDDIVVRLLHDAYHEAFKVAKLSGMAATCRQGS